MSHEDESTDPGNGDSARAGPHRPAAFAEDDDDDNYGAATATATAASTATAGSDEDDDDGAELPSTGGPALIAPLAGALLLGSGALAGFVALRRTR